MGLLDYWERLATPVVVPNEDSWADDPWGTSIMAPTLTPQQRAIDEARRYRDAAADYPWSPYYGASVYRPPGTQVSPDEYVGRTQAPDDSRESEPEADFQVTFSETGRPMSGQGFDNLGSQYSGFFPSSQLGVAANQLDDVWDGILSVSGIDELASSYGVDENWWPGLELKQLNTFEQHMGAVASGPGSLYEYLESQGRVIEPWAIGRNVTVENEQGQSFSRWIRYDTARSTQSYAAMGTNDRELYTNLMVNAGLLADGYAGIAEFTAEGATAFTEATRWANYYGITVKQFLERQATLKDRLEKGNGRGGSGAGRRYTIEVPDYATITEYAKEMMRQKLGRDPKSWEITLVADELQRQYGSWADQQKRKALGGNGVYEMPDPQKLTEGFIESKYEDEIERLEDVQEHSENNRLLVRAATAGAALNQAAPTRLGR